MCFSPPKNLTFPHTGIPRLRKLIETKTKEKSATVFLKKPFCGSEKAASDILKAIQSTTLKQIVSIGTVEEEAPDARTASPPEDEPVRALYAALPLSETPDENTSRHLVRFKLLKVKDASLFFLKGGFKLSISSNTLSLSQTHPLLLQRAMMERNLVPSDVADAISRYLLAWGVEVQWSETNMDEWVVRIRLKEARQLLAGKSPESDRAVDRAINEALQADLLRKVQVSGITGITGGSLRKIRVDRPDDATGAVVATEEWIIDTEGTALEKLLALDFVDATRTYSNDVGEIEEVFGIEAASTVLFHELKQVIYFGGTYIDPRHIELLVSTMTHLGYQVALSRFGINRLDTGPLVKMSFEQTYEVVTQAAIQGESDRVQGPTPSVMMGQLAPLPTGVVELRPTPEYVQKIADLRSAATRSARLVVTIPRERPRKIFAPTAPRKASGTEARGEVARMVVLPLEKDPPSVRALSPAPSPVSSPPRKRARPASVAPGPVSFAVLDPKTDRLVEEDPVHWPVPPEYALFGGWEGTKTWSPCCAA